MATRGYDPEDDNFRLALDASMEFRQILDAVCVQIGASELGRRIGYAESTVSRTRQGHRLPTRTFVRAFARATVGDKPEQARERDRLMVAAGFMPLETVLDLEAGHGGATDLYGAQLRALEAILARRELPPIAKEVTLATIRSLTVALSRYIAYPVVQPED